MSSHGTDEFFTLVVIVNALIIVLSATVLLVSLPRRVKQELQRRRKLFDCWIGLLVVVGLTTLPTNLLVCFVHFELIPWPLAARALKTATVAEDADAMRDKLEEVQDDHRDWVAAHGRSSESAEEIQYLLWNNWPLIVLGCLALTGFSIWLLGRFYTQLVLYLLKTSIPRP